MQLLLAATLTFGLADVVNGQATNKHHIGTTCVWSVSPFYCGKALFEGNFWLTEVDDKTKDDTLGRGQIWDGMIQAGNKETKTFCFVTGTDKDGGGVAANYIEPRLSIHHSCCKDSKTKKAYSQWYRKSLKDIPVRHDGALKIEGVNLKHHCSIE